MPMGIDFITRNCSETSVTSRDLNLNIRACECLFSDVYPQLGEILVIDPTFLPSDPHLLILGS